VRDWARRANLGDASWGRDQDAHGVEEEGGGCGDFCSGGFASPTHPSYLLKANVVYSTIVTGLVRVVLGFRSGSRVPSYSNTEIWTTVHAGMSIVCASLPIFRPLMRRITFSAFVTRLLSVFSMQKKSSLGGPATETKESPLSSTDVRILSFVRIERQQHTVQAPVPAFVQLPIIQVKHRHDSLMAQWAGFLEESQRMSTYNCKITRDQIQGQIEET
jgi:hypothetical protein